MASRLATHNTNSEIKGSGTLGFFRPRLSINQPGDVYEQEADTAAEKVMQARGSENIQKRFFKPVTSSIQRKCSQCDEEEKKTNTTKRK
jgi:hypothetical protein